MPKPWRPWRPLRAEQVQLLPIHSPTASAAGASVPSHFHVFNFFVLNLPATNLPASLVAALPANAAVGISWRPPRV